MTEELSYYNISMTKVLQEEQCHRSSSPPSLASTPLPDQHLQPFTVKAFLGPSSAPFALPPPPPPTPSQNPLLLTFLKFAQSLAPSIATRSVSQNPSDVLCSVEVLD